VLLPIDGRRPWWGAAPRLTALDAAGQNPRWTSSLSMRRRGDTTELGGGGECYGRRAVREGCFQATGGRMRRRSSFAWGGGGVHKSKGPASNDHGGSSTSAAGACVATLVPFDTQNCRSSTQLLRFSVGVPIWEPPIV
jgi:hypothetical protein